MTDVARDDAGARPEAAPDRLRWDKRLYARWFMAAPLSAEERDQLAIVAASELGVSRAVASLNKANKRCGRRNASYYLAFLYVVFSGVFLAVGASRDTREWNLLYSGFAAVILLIAYVLLFRWALPKKRTREGLAIEASVSAIRELNELIAQGASRHRRILVSNSLGSVAYHLKRYYARPLLLGRFETANVQLGALSSEVAASVRSLAREVLVMTPDRMIELRDDLWRLTMRVAEGDVGGICALRRGETPADGTGRGPVSAKTVFAVVASLAVAFGGAARGVAELWPLIFGTDPGTGS